MYSYEAEQVRLQRMMDECFREHNGNENIIYADVQDEGEEDKVNEIYADTDIEQEISITDNADRIDSGSYFLGKNNTRKLTKHICPRSVKDLIVTKNLIIQT